MKRILLIIVSIVLLSLCACGKNSNQDIEPSTTPSQASIDNAEEATAGTAEATQVTTVGPTNAPTAESTNVPTEPTTEPTETQTTVPIACSHSYKHATCTTPETCTKCGTTKGSVAGHSYQDATCTTPKTCTKCGESSGSATGHSYANATCTTPITCSICKSTNGNALGHNWANATCTAPKTCSVCKISEGTTTNHIYKDGKCSICKKEDAVNPQEHFKTVDYISIEKRGNELTTLELTWNGETFDYFESMYIKTDGDPERFIDYEGERYYLCGGGGPPLTYILTDTYIEFIDPGNNPCAKYTLQHDGSLRLIICAEGWYFPQLLHQGNLTDYVS